MWQLLKKLDLLLWDFEILHFLNEIFIKTGPYDRKKNQNTMIHFWNQTFPECSYDNLPYSCLLEFFNSAWLCQQSSWYGVFVRRPSICDIDYFWSYCMDFFKVLVVSSPWPYAQNFFFFFFNFFTNQNFKKATPHANSNRKLSFTEFPSQWSSQNYGWELKFRHAGVRRPSVHKIFFLRNCQIRLMPNLVERYLFHHISTPFCFSKLCIFTFSSALCYCTAELLS